MSKNSFTLPSFAKINWFLRVLGKRGDGFHELCTAFQTVSLCDELTFSESKDINFSCDAPGVPHDETNLVVRAAKMLREKYAIEAGAKVHLVKRIPAPGGLGGGSSNAAVALIGLNELWKINAKIDELQSIGEKIGSDVPFFFRGGTALGTGRGTDIEPLEDLAENCLLIVTPAVNVSTRDAFARLGAPHLTNEKAKSILEICRNEAKRLDLRQVHLINDFEPSVFAIEPEIARVKEKLFALGAQQVLLSGSGASVYAVFEKLETRQTTLKALETEKNWRMFAVATVSRSEYRDRLKLNRFCD